MTFAFPNLLTITISPYLFEKLDKEVVAVTTMSEVYDEMKSDEGGSDEEASDSGLRYFNSVIEFCCLLAQIFVTVPAFGLPGLAILKC